MVDASRQINPMMNTTGIQVHLPLVRESGVSAASEYELQTDSSSSCDQDDSWTSTESSGSESEEITNSVTQKRLE